ncbi:MAG: hypothetical protein WCS86_02125 [Candidatus Paceibacterota bacterium]
MGDIKHLMDNLSNPYEIKGGKSREEIHEELKPFVDMLFPSHYNTQERVRINIVPPSEIGWEKELDPKGFGEYTINPETAGIDYKGKRPKIRIIKMDKFVGKSMSESIRAISKEYGKEYLIPGFELEKYLLENQEEIPKEITNAPSENCYFFVGSGFRNHDGSFNIPYISQLSARLAKDTIQLNKGSKLGENHYFVLLER